MEVESSADPVEASTDSSGDVTPESGASAEPAVDEQPEIYPRNIQDSPRIFRLPPVRRRSQFYMSGVRLARLGPSRIHRSCRSVRGTFFRLPFVTEDNVVIFSKPQALRRSVDEVDQLLKKLDLQKEKSKIT